jgi:hypothetical protein
MACDSPPRVPAAEEYAKRVGAAQLAPLVTRVEEARGLRFRRRVTAYSVSPPAVRALLERELDRGLPREEIAQQTALAASLGLVPRDFDMRASLLAFQVENVSGFYAPLVDRLYLVRGAASAAGQSEEALVVHELMHALQAQQLPLFDALLGLQGDDDLAFALAALLEGEATFVELSDAAASGGTPRPAPSAFAAQFSAGVLAPGLPRVVAESVVAPYPLGYALADALVARGGVRALDAAHADPPLSSEELLHLERYLDPAARRPLADLPRDPGLSSCSVTATNCYGELVLRGWLHELGAGPDLAASAADGWDGDRAFALRCGRRAASAWLIQADDPAEARELAGALRGRAPAVDALALRLDAEGSRVLVSRGLSEGERTHLLALPELGRRASLRAHLDAHPEVARRARRLR